MHKKNCGPLVKDTMPVSKRASEDYKRMRCCLRGSLNQAHLRYNTLLANIATSKKCDFLHHTKVELHKTASSCQGHKRCMGKRSLFRKSEEKLYKLNAQAARSVLSDKHFIRPIERITRAASSVIGSSFENAAHFLSKKDSGNGIVSETNNISRLSLVVSF